MSDFFDRVGEDMDFEDFYDENMNINPKTGEYCPRLPFEDDDDDEI